MKILNPTQIKELEIQSVQKENIELYDLMERAATAVLDVLKEDFDLKKSHFSLLCGSGNNGGDGLALARLLRAEGAEVEVFLIEAEHYSIDNLRNQKRLNEVGIEIQYFNLNEPLTFEWNRIIIDALFGFGLNRPLSKEWRPLINQLNGLSNLKFSIDLPSGLMAEELNSPSDAILKPDEVFTFEMPKTSFFWKENQEFVPKFKVLSIGLNPTIREQFDSEVNYFTDEIAQTFRMKRSRFAYKYQFGNVLVVGGSYGKIGAVYLSSKAAFRSGAGLVTAYVPKCGETILQTNLPDAMVLTDFSSDKLIGFPKVDRFGTLIIGPGLGTDEKTADAFAQFLEENEVTNKKILLDADALNLLAHHPNLLHRLPQNTILTPHDKELERLIGEWENSIEKNKKLKEFSMSYHLIVVSKGANTQTYLPSGEVWINSTGNSGMAVAGTGDVLSGIVGGLLGRGLEPKDAATLGVYLHGKAGDLAAEKLGQESLMASDLLEYLPKAIKSLNE